MQIKTQSKADTFSPKGSMLTEESVIHKPINLILSWENDGNNNRLLTDCTKVKGKEVKKEPFIGIPKYQKGVKRIQKALTRSLNNKKIFPFDNIKIKVYI